VASGCTDAREVVEIMHSQVEGPDIQPVPCKEARGCTDGFAV
jgi:hypothetical protein